MVVFIFEKVPATLRGELSRWLIEPRAGIFTGRLSGIVRDKLWETAKRRTRGGSAILLYSAPTEQGFIVKSHGDPKRTLVRLDGLDLIRIPKPPDEEEEEAGNERSD